jgi:host factor-I protein
VCRRPGQIAAELQARQAANLLVQGSTIQHVSGRSGVVGHHRTLGPAATLCQPNNNNTDGQKTMAEKAQSLQDTFLNHVRKNKTPLTIFLMNGVKLQGVVTWFDNFCVLLRRDGHSQLVYKHAISTIMPGQPVHLMETDPAEGQQG